MNGAQVIGIKEVNFKAQDGKEVSGLTIYIMYRLANVEGCAAERIFVSFDRLSGVEPKVGDNVNVYYNRYGKVACLEVI